MQGAFQDFIFLGENVIIFVWQKKLEKGEREERDEGERKGRQNKERGRKRRTGLFQSSQIKLIQVD